MSNKLTYPLPKSMYFWGNYLPTNRVSLTSTAFATWTSKRHVASLNSLQISVDKKTTKTSSKIPRKPNENWWQLKRSDAIQGSCDQSEHYPKFPLRKHILRVDEKSFGNPLENDWPLKGTGVETRPTPGKSQQELQLGHDWLQFLTPNLDPAQNWRPVLLINTYFHTKDNKMQQKPCKSQGERGAGNRIRFPWGPSAQHPCQLQKSPGSAKLEKQ